MILAVSTTITQSLAAAIAIVLGCAAVYASYAFFKAFQQRGYKKTGYLKWLFKDNFKYMSRLTNISLLSFFAYFTFSVLFSVFAPELVKYLGLIFFVIFLIYFRLSSESKSDRQNLEYTSRMKRLTVTTIIVAAAIIYGIMNLMAFLGSLNIGLFFVYLGFAPVCFITLLMPFAVIIADRINYPIEEYKRRRYKFLASERLKTNPNLITVGITGSFGKTTVKNILGKILEQKYSVLITPKSYNTPMGISKSILNGYTGQDIFVCEMGARRKGDIEEICKFIPTNIGVITAVSRQHIESFKNFDNILDTKYELAENLVGDGAMFFSSDNEGAETLYNRYERKKHLVGLKECDYGISAENVTVGCFGSEFTLTIDNEKRTVKTVLLGQHNISNILLACAVAKNLGLNIDEIAKGIENTESVPHRLQLIPNNKNVNIIDDSFNANIHGVKAALEVLKLFSGRKFVITSGLIELKNLEKYENKKLGESLAEAADEVILIGELRAKPIVEGLKEKDFPDNKIHICSHVVAGAEIFSGLAKEGDTVLFLNDLPDTYLS